SPRVLPRGDSELSHCISWRDAALMVSAEACAFRRGVQNRDNYFTFVPAGSLGSTLSSDGSPSIEAAGAVADLKLAATHWAHSSAPARCDGRATGIFFSP